MQGLTRRGIEMTEKLRQHGIPVIESYPGAAQDILGIPRKKTDEKLLSLGLSSFGFSIDNHLTHDELDAITSAMVGYFYLADEYEGIGAEDEGYMIIPRWDRRMVWMPTNSTKRVISLIGLPGSGKTTLSRALSERLGWQNFVLGDALRCRASNNRSLSILLANGELAPEALVEELIRDALGATNVPGTVLDGFPRHLTQAALFDELQVAPQFLFLDIDQQIARRRLLARNTESSAHRPEDQSNVIDKRLAYSKHNLVELLDAMQGKRLIRLDASRNTEDLVDCAVQSLLQTSVSS